MSDPRLLILPLIVLLLAACGSEKPNDTWIYHTEGLTVWPDSLRRDGHTYSAIGSGEIAGAWVSDHYEIPLPRLHTTLPLADALFRKAIEADSDPTPLGVWLSRALTDPEGSMAALREVCTVISPRWPVEAQHSAWISAAWEVYCATGSRQWLSEAYAEASRRLRDLSLMERAGLTAGLPEWSTERWADFYPGWMSPADRYDCLTARRSVWHAVSLHTAAQMASALGSDNDAKRLKARYKQMRTAINDRLWLPQRELYTAGLYTRYYPIPAPVTDNTASSLCVITSIATPEMSAALVSAMPVIPAGVPAIYPGVAAPPRPDPAAAALYAIAGARSANPDAMLHGIASTWASSLDHTLPALWPAIMLRGIFGITLGIDGMTFAPFVPAAIGGEKTIEGLRYRDAELKLTLRGTGNRIVQFTIDGRPQSTPKIPAELTGCHNIEITLSGNDLTTRPIALSGPATVIPTPKLHRASPDQYRILDHHDGYTYKIYTNGVLTEEIQDNHFTISPGRPLVSAVEPLSHEGLSGFSPRPQFSGPENTQITIEASRITPRRPPHQLARFPQRARDYIELAPAHNTRLTCYTVVPDSGTYFLTLHYSNGSNTMGLRSLHVNDLPAGTLLCPPLNPGDWLRTSPSNTVTVSLRPGPNKFSLTYISGTILFHSIQLIRKS